MSQYPHRDSHHAHRLTRLMAKTCAAMQIGVDAAFLVTIIAHTEDAARYRGPVTFYNNQLQQILGFAKWERLKRSRNAAMESGWLHYEEQGTRMPGIYWTLLPDRLSDVEDNFSDEGLYPLEGYKQGYNEGYKQGVIDGRKSSLSPSEGDNEGYNKGDNEGYKQGYNEGDPSTLSLSLSLREEKESLRDPPLFEEFTSRWNELPPAFPRMAKLTDKRRKALKSRAADTDWKRSWRDAIERMAKSRFCRGENDRGWVSDPDWFLKPDTVTKILEGKYDDRPTTSPKPIASSGPRIRSAEETKQYLREHGGRLHVASTETRKRESEVNLG